MLLFLKGTVKDQIINFDLPDLYFTTKQYVEVKQIGIKWKTEVQHVSGRLTSTLIDRSIYNPDQTIALFSQAEKSNYLLVTPPSGLQYQIQLWSLRQSLFKIVTLEKHQIEEIEIILNIDGLF